MLSEIKAGVERIFDLKPEDLCDVLVPVEHADHIQVHVELNGRSMNIGQFNALAELFYTKAFDFRIEVRQEECATALAELFETQPIITVLVIEAPVAVAKAAIKCRGVIRCISRPSRHTDLLRIMISEENYESGENTIEGFILTDGSFVDRKQALKAARTAQQGLHNLNACHDGSSYEGLAGKGLSTNDLW